MTQPDVLARYEQAQALEQGALSTRTVLNDAVLPHWLDEQRFWYVCETREGKAFRLVDAAAASNETAFDHVALAEALSKVSGKSSCAENLPIVIESLQLSPLQVRFNAFGQHWLFDQDNGTCETMAENSKGVADNELLSPDGNQIAFVRDHNLWLRDVASGKERALTQDGCADNAYATAAQVVGFPLTPKVQALWSADSRQLITHQLDLRGVAERHVIKQVPQDGTIRPQLTSYKAAYPGDEKVETLRLLAIDTHGGEQRPADYAPLYLCRSGNGFFTQEKFGWWGSDNRQAYFVDIARGSTAVRVVAWDTESGATKVLFEDTSETPIRLSNSFMMGIAPLFMPLSESDELIWYAERSGWGHLYLYDLKTGQLKRQLTEGDWIVRNTLYLDQAQRELWIHTAGRDTAVNPYYRDLCRVNLDSGELTPVCTGPYEHVVYDSGPWSGMLVPVRGMFDIDNPQVNGFSPDGNYLVVTRSRVDQAPVSLLFDRTGHEILTVETADPHGLPEGWQWPEPVSVKAADGETDLYGVIYRPPGFDPKQSYPVLEFFSCGHPDMVNLQHSSFCNGPLFGLPYARASAYAALGFIVVTLEGRGTPFRGKAFHDDSAGDINGANSFDDHISGLQQLAGRYPAMDLERVGVIAPDSLSAPLYGLLQHPEFYKVGVGVGCSDPRFAPASMMETLEGYPANPNTPAAEELVDALQGKLLLVQGLLDPIAPPEGFFRVIEALQKANKDVDMLCLPNLGHDLPTYIIRRSWDYLTEHLLGEAPPREFTLRKAADLLLAAKKQQGST